MFLFWCVLVRGFCYQDTIDRIVAVVDDRVITLTDIRIMEAFALYDEIEQGAEEKASLILDRLIDQKLVLQLSPENIAVSQSELDEYRKILTARLGEEQVEKALDAFGLQWADLRPYLREKILYQKIISQRFGQTAVVSLEEIEEYYQRRYLPSQTEKGREPQPMMEMLVEIESIIRENKIERRVQDWLKNLRRQADIQIKVRDLNKYIMQ
jgi:hypothetical protein